MLWKGNMMNISTQVTIRDKGEWFTYPFRARQDIIEFFYKTLKILFCKRKGVKDYFSIVCYCLMHSVLDEYSKIYLTTAFYIECRCNFLIALEKFFTLHPVLYLDKAKWRISLSYLSLDILFYESYIKYWISNGFFFW